MVNSAGEPRMGKFRRGLQEEFQRFLRQQAAKYPIDQCLRVDLHCHDYNGDLPDDLWGRILRLPETWLPTDRLVAALQRNGSDVVTITNHNNARSIWDLQDAGQDVLTACEFTCHFAEYDLFLHVLTSRKRLPIARHASLSEVSPRWRAMRRSPGPSILVAACAK